MVETQIRKLGFTFSNCVTGKHHLANANDRLRMTIVPRCRREADGDGDGDNYHPVDAVPRNEDRTAPVDDAVAQDVDVASNPHFADFDNTRTHFVKKTKQIADDFECILIDCYMEKLYRATHYNYHRIKHIHPYIHTYKHTNIQTYKAAVALLAALSVALLLSFFEPVLVPVAAHEVERGAQMVDCDVVRHALNLAESIQVLAYQIDLVAVQRCHQWRHFQWLLVRGTHEKKK